MKLELKHLAPYLPYGLMISQYRDDLNINFTSEMIGLSSDQIKVILSRYPFSEKISYYEAKPILRPLSDLTDSKVKEMFNVNYSSVKCKMYDGTLNLDVREYSDINLIYYLPQLNKLFEHHFDVFGLIDQGLAIDINTLES